MAYSINRKKDIFCPICDSTSSLWVHLPNVSLFRCTKCNHCFSDIRGMNLQETYNSQYFYKTHRNWFENSNITLFSLLHAMISKQDAKSLLDVGCGNGAFLKYMRDVNNILSLKGIDLSDNTEQDSIVFINGDFLNHKFKETFDAIVCLAVIEHLIDIRSFTGRFHELLNPNGMAYIMTLNEDSILYRFANIARSIGVSSPFLRLYDSHHVNHFNQKNLIHLLTKDGLFELAQIVNHNTVLSAIDIPTENLLVRQIMKLGVSVLFFLGKITQKTYLQTIILKKI